MFRQFKASPNKEMVYQGMSTSQLPLLHMPSSPQGRSEESSFARDSLRLGTLATLLLRVSRFSLTGLRGFA